MQAAFKVTELMSGVRTLSFWNKSPSSPDKYQYIPSGSCSDAKVADDWVPRPQQTKPFCITTLQHLASLAISIVAASSSSLRSK